MSSAAVKAARPARAAFLLGECGRFLTHALMLFLIAGSAPGCRRGPDQNLAHTPNTAGSVFFQEATAQARLTFVHDFGKPGTYFMPEHIGSGAALFDFDNDGRLDIYLIQCGGRDSSSRNRLFQQRSDGTFDDVSAGSGLDVAGYGMGAAIGDVNNDGWADVLVTEYGAARLFLNTGSGKFREITGSAGIDNPRWATAASFFDYDRDGWLDLVIANYVDYNPTQKCFDAAGVQEYCGPQNFEGTVTRLFRNRSTGSGEIAFEDVTLRSGLARHSGPALGILCADFDGDRWPDIFVADDGKPNRLFVNRRDGTFSEEAAVRGLAYNVLGETAGNMGVALGDVNRDGLFDLFVTHLMTEQHALWAQGPRGLFQDRTAEFNLTNPAWRGTGFGTVLADFDLDGRLDLAFVNGLVRRGHNPPTPVEQLHPFWFPYAQRAQVFSGSESGKFVDVSAANAAFCGRAAVGRGLAYGDIDNDGDVDLLATSTGGPAQLFRNVAPRRGHWITVRALDPKLGGRDAYGAEIVARAGGRDWWGLVQPSTSYLASNDPRVFFGLGDATGFESIRVVWPDGVEEVFEGGATDRHIVLKKGEGKRP